jgi:hypothetical protein
MKQRRVRARRRLAIPEVGGAPPVDDLLTPCGVKHKLKPNIIAPKRLAVARLMCADADNCRAHLQRVNF